jgi:hypothetical protein
MAWAVRKQSVAISAAAAATPSATLGDSVSAPRSNGTARTVT